MLQNLLGERVGVLVESAGTWATPGAPANPEARELASSIGVNLSHHSARSVVDLPLESFDLILTMEDDQREALAVEYATLADRIHTLAGLAGESFDIPDPSGRPQGELRQFLQLLDSTLKKACERISALEQEERREEFQLKIVLTGGAGFIGSHVARAYQRAGHEVLVVDDLSRGDASRIPEGVPLVQLDICDQDALGQTVQRFAPEVINHHAGLVSVRESHSRPHSYWQNNVQGTKTVLQAALEGSVERVIFASSGGAVYGEARHLPIGEDHPLIPISPYGETQVACERVLEEATVHDLEVVCLRYGNVFGPDQDPEGGNGVVAIFSQAMLLGRRPVIYGDGSQLRDYVYVKDAAHANVLALRTGLQGTFNIGSGIGTDLIEVHAHLAHLMDDGRPPKYLPANEFEVQRNVLDSHRAEEAMGWRPEVPLDEGLRRTISAMRRRLHVAKTDAR